MNSILKKKANLLAHKGYDLTYKFPKDELFGLTSQVRRSLVSVPSNLIEGYSRNKSKVFLNFLEISYASLAEAKYQIYFAYKRGYISKDAYMDFYKDSEEVSKMLWASINTISNKLKNLDCEND
ncbi:MAG: four helix bundle protein [Patescibacteria group bacterium]